MVDQTIRLIPSKKTRLRIFILLELFVTGLLLLAFFDIGTQVGVTAAWWSAFTQWNAGIYASSETVIKGAEGYMNK